MPLSNHPTEARAAPPAASAERGAHAAADAVGHAADAAAGHPLTGLLMRLGYIVRGIIYLLPGVLALRMALGTHGGGGGGAITPNGAVEMIAQQPLGRFLLIPIAAGLAGYSLWGVIRAVLDPLNRGHSPKGIGTRLGYALSALAFAGLFAATLRFIAGSMAHIPEDRDWTAELFAHPAGRWLVGIIGLCWIAGAGISQIVIGWTGSFEKDLKKERMTSTEHWLAVRLGRVGITVRGVVFTVIGMLIVAAALHLNPQDSRGMDGALLELLHQPFGRALLAFVALGLITFGTFSVMCARWMRLPSSRPRQLEQPHPSRSSFV
jgi:hypothetical protein